MLDITERHDLYEIANRLRPDAVVHCAASYSDPDKWHLDTRTNVEGSINAALVAKHHDAHLVYFQTILPPVSSYAISKIAAEQYLRLSGVPLTVFRLANIYGPRNLSGPVPVFYKRLTGRLPCTVVDTARDMVYVGDLIRGVVSAITERTVGTFDMCSGRQTPIIELFRLVAAAVGVHDDPPVVPPAADDVQGSVHPERRLPGWQPLVVLPTGIAATVASYQEHGITDTYTHLTMRG